MEDLRQQGLRLLAPYRSAKREPFRFPMTLTHMRYRIETVIGQLVERFHIKKVWTRDLWHLTSRWMRKLLSHTVVVYFCFQSGLPPLSLVNLVQLNLHIGLIIPNPDKLNFDWGHKIFLLFKNRKQPWENPYSMLP